MNFDLEIIEDTNQCQKFLVSSLDSESIEFKNLFLGKVFTVNIKNKETNGGGENIILQKYTLRFSMVDDKLILGCNAI